MNPEHNIKPAKSQDSAKKKEDKPKKTQTAEGWKRQMLKKRKLPKPEE